MIAPTKKMPNHMRRVMTPSLRGRGGFVHHALVRRVNAERKRGRAVRHEIDPQDLRRQKRQHDSIPSACKPITFASSTPKNIVITSPMFDESR